MNLIKPASRSQRLKCDSYQRDQGKGINGGVLFFGSEYHRAERQDRFIHFTPSGRRARKDPDQW